MVHFQRKAINRPYKTREPINQMINFPKRFIKKAINSIGLDIIRLSKSPSYSLLGLRNLPIRTIIDVGANEGQFTKMVIKIFPDAEVYCFEPLPEPFKKLEKWVKEKGKGKIRVSNLALGNYEGTVEMFSHTEHSLSSSLLKTTKICHQIYPVTEKQTPIPIKLTTLDNWVKRRVNPLTHETFIKLDIQGYEDRVIKGGRETFKTAKACILEVGLDTLYENQATFKDISLLLYDLGYHYIGNLEQSYADDGHVIFIDAVFMR